MTHFVGANNYSPIGNAAVMANSYSPLRERFRVMQSFLRFLLLTASEFVVLADGFIAFGRRPFHEKFRYNPFQPQEPEDGDAAERHGGSWVPAMGWRNVSGKFKQLI
jgi:hypothetical protein